ncbi:sulfotransferase [Candidatus Neomarinimicrobiota bacterium]
MKISFLFGITTGRWIRLLRENRFRVALRYLHRALLLTILSLFNSYHYRKEERCYHNAIVNNDLEPQPIFIMGHWRSGTTHLHNILNKDPRLATPNTYQVMFPHTFLTTEDTMTVKLASAIPNKRPQDNVPLGWDTPQEDEIAMCMYTPYSTALSFSFPQRALTYDRYMSFREVPEVELEDWKRSYKYFAQKLTFKYQCPVVLKSPLHTCRIKVLLDLFPNARFIHIVRNPYRVFVSSVYLLEALQRSYFLLQRPNNIPFSDRVLDTYQLMHEVYFEEVGMIPEGQFHFLRHEDLVKDTMGEMRKLYETLSLPDFVEFEPALQEYVESLAGYRKNVYAPMDPTLKENIAARWRRNFEEWNYPLD